MSAWANRSTNAGSTVRSPSDMSPAHDVLEVGPDEQVAAAADPAAETDEVVDLAVDVLRLTDVDELRAPTSKSVLRPRTTA